MPTRTADAVWEGNLAQGKGSMRLGSKAFEGAYSFPSRFESGDGTNPEELIAAAHAGCFAMAFSHGLDQAGFTAERTEVNAQVMLEKGDGGFAITGIHLQCQAKVPGIEEAKFQELAQEAKQGCPVSKALAAVAISLEATLLA